MGGRYRTSQIFDRPYISPSVLRRSPRQPGCLRAHRLHAKAIALFFLSMKPCTVSLRVSMCMLAMASPPQPVPWCLRPASSVQGPLNKVSFSCERTLLLPLCGRIQAIQLLGLFVFLTPSLCQRFVNGVYLVGSSNMHYRSLERRGPTGHNGSANTSTVNKF